MRSRPLARAGLLLACLLTWTTTASADGDSAGLERRAARARSVLSADDIERRQWQRDYRRHLVAVAGARARSESARTETLARRKHHRLRGENRVNERARTEAAQEELERAQAGIKAFKERARREGARPGWLRSVDEEFRDRRGGAASR